MNLYDNDVFFSFFLRFSIRIIEVINFNCYWVIIIIWNFRYFSYNYSRLYVF